MQKLFSALPCRLYRSFFTISLSLFTVFLTASIQNAFCGGPAEIDIRFPQADILLFDPDSDPQFITSNEDDGARMSRITASLEAGIVYYLIILPRDIDGGAESNQYQMQITGPGGTVAAPEPDDPYIGVEINGELYAGEFTDADQVDRYIFQPAETGFYVIEMIPNVTNHKPGNPQKWQVPEVPFRMDNGTLGDFDETTARQMVRDAVALWNGVPTAGIQLVEGDALPDDVEVGDATRLTVAGHTLFFDQTRNRVMAFGGYDNDFVVNNDLFEFDGNSWIYVETEDSPSARTYAASTYDSVNQQLVLHGGFGVDGNGQLNPLSDTWVWDGQNWTQKDPTNIPPARFLGAMAYDEFFGDVVLFGGRTNSELLGDTWLWDGEDWLDQTNAQYNPGERFGHTLFYDPVNEQIYLIHGTTGSGDYFDMWLWRGTAWSDISDAVETPPARAFSTVTADRERNQTILFGGDSGNNGNLNDTWIWDGNTWTETAPESSPSTRFESNMVFDEEQNQIFLLAGREGDTVLNDNWTWDGVTWSRLGQLDEIETQFNDFIDQGINPIVFDSDGSLTDLLLGDGMKEFYSSFTEITRSDGEEILSARMILNGWFLSEAAGDDQLTQEEFTNELVHEFGHFLGLTNTQLNAYKPRNNDPSDDKSVSLMYPFRLEVTDDSLALHHDDITAISELYPAVDGSFESSYGTISGTALFESGLPVLGGIVIARKADDPDQIVVSRMTDDRAQLTGAFTLPGLPAGDYIVSIEPVDGQFFDSGSVGFHSIDENGASFVNPPVPEYYNGDAELGDPADENPSEYTLVSVQAGQVTEIDFTCTYLTSNRLRASQFMAYDLPFLSGITGEERGTGYYPFSVNVGDEHTAINVELESDATLPLTVRVESNGAVVYSNQHYPEARRNMGMVFDSIRNQTVMFGGWLETGPENDTWLWNGETWDVGVSAERPASRVIHNLVYDEARERTISFGGTDSPLSNDGFYFSDTWEWDGDEWTRVDTETAPTSRIGISAAYDSSAGLSYIFGGIEFTGSWLNDTWSFDGSTWAEIVTGNAPQERNAHAMVYDKARQQVMMFSGGDNQGTPLEDTWVFDGADWEELSPANSPTGRRFYAMAYDSDREVTVLFGGTDEDGNHLGDTWEWDGSDWTEINTPTAPVERSRHVMAYDSARQKIVLFGGITTEENVRLNDTWEYDVENGWVDVSPALQPNSFTYSQVDGMKPGIHYFYVESAEGLTGNYSIKVTPSTDGTVSVGDWELY